MSDACALKREPQAGKKHEDGQYEPLQTLSMHDKFISWNLNECPIGAGCMLTHSVRAVLLGTGLNNKISETR